MLDTSLPPPPRSMFLVLMFLNSTSNTLLEKSSKSKKSEAEFFNESQPKKEIKAERVADQKSVDAALLSEIKKTPLLKQYLAASFSLKNGDRPHLLKF